VNKRLLHILPAPSERKRTPAGLVGSEPLLHRRAAICAIAACVLPLPSLASNSRSGIDAVPSKTWEEYSELAHDLCWMEAHADNAVTLGGRLQLVRWNNQTVFAYMAMARRHVRHVASSLCRQLDACGLQPLGMGAGQWLSSRNGFAVAGAFLLGDVTTIRAAIGKQRNRIS